MSSPPPSLSPSAAPSPPASALDVTLNHLTLRFVAPETERRYRLWHYESSRTYMRVGLLVSAVFMALMGPLEWVALPEEAARFALTVRYGVVLPCIGLLYALTVVPALQPFTRRYRQEVTLLVAPLIFIALGVIGSVTAPALGIVPDGYGALGFMIALLFMYLIVRLRFLYALGVCVPLHVIALPLLLEGQLDEITMVSTFIYTVISNAVGAVGCYLIDLSSRRVFRSELRMQDAHARVDELLCRALPTEIVPRLHAAPGSLAERHDDATVIFAHVVGLTELSARVAPVRLVTLLDAIFVGFDQRAATLGVAKVKTIGAVWMGVAGALSKHDAHALAVAHLARQMQGHVAEIAAAHGVALTLRVGVHTGAVVGGVIGARKLAWDIWGDTVNLAARMESTCAPGQVQVSQATADALGQRFEVRERGAVQAKGVGEVTTCWLGNPLTPPPPPPEPPPPPPRSNWRRDHLHTLALRFRERATERAYWQDYAQRQAGTLRVMGLCAIVAALPVDLMEARFFPEIVGSLRFWRFGVLIPACLFGVAALTIPSWFKRVGGPYLQEVFAALTLVSFFALAQTSAAVLSVGGGDITVYLGSGYLASISVLYVVLRLRFLYAAVIGVSALVFGALVLLASGAMDPAGGGLAVHLCSLGAFAGALGCYHLEITDRRHFFLRGQIASEHARAASLLDNTLPPSVAERLAHGERPLADAHEDVAVVFADLVGFTAYARTVTPEQLVVALDALFRRFDARCAALGAEKIKTMGDAWTAVVGAPTPVADHIEVAVELALALQAEVAGWCAEHDAPLRLRVGVHRGPVVAGVIGQDRVQYDVWGDTVNVASRLESHGVPGHVQVSDVVAAVLPSRFALDDQGLVQLKGRGAVRAWMVSAPDISLTELRQGPKSG